MSLNVPTSLAAKRNYYIPPTYKVGNDNLVSDHKKKQIIQQFADLFHSKLLITRP